MACSMESMRTYIAPIWRASSRAILVYATRGSPAKYSQHFLIMELQHNDLGGEPIHRDARKWPVPVTPTVSTCSMRARSGGAECGRWGHGAIARRGA